MSQRASFSSWLSCSSLLACCLLAACVLPPQGPQPGAAPAWGAPAAPPAEPSDQDPWQQGEDGDDADGDADDSERDDAPQVARPAPSPSRTPVSSSGRGQWSCHAEGAYQTCSSAGLCTTWPVTGMGLGTTESQARIQAETSCSGHMSNLLATANLGDSSASIRSTCAVTRCSP